MEQLISAEKVESFVQTLIDDFADVPHLVIAHSCTGHFRLKKFRFGQKVRCCMVNLLMYRPKPLPMYKDKQTAEAASQRQRGGVQMIIKAADENKAGR